MAQLSIKENHKHNDFKNAYKQFLANLEKANEIGKGSRPKNIQENSTGSKLRSNYKTVEARSFNDQLPKNEYTKGLDETSGSSLDWEEVRLRSFENYKSKNAELVFNVELKKKYALVGLYWTQNARYEEEVKCHFCHFRLVGLNSTDTDPVALHCRFQSSCPLLKLQETKNLPIDHQLFLESILIKPFCPQYEKKMSRLKTFDQIKEPFLGILATAGFFKCKHTHKIKCFYCVGETDNTKEYINILRVHIDLKYCPFYLEWRNLYKTLLEELYRRNNEVKCTEQFYSEADRLRSFDGDFSKFFEITDELKKQCAAAGFYRMKQNGNIKCSFCHIKLELRENDTEPLVMHLRKNASCTLMRLDEPRNKPIDKNHPFAKDLMGTPYFQRYRNPVTRLQSFNRLKLEEKVNQKMINSLGLAGFFVINESGKVICFYCCFEADISKGRHQILHDHPEKHLIYENKKIDTGKNSDANFYLEAERLNSFENYVCENENFDFNDDLRKEYALVGFYSTNSENEEIKCIFCDLKLNSLNDDCKDPVALHRKHNTCNLMKLQEPRNFPIDNELLHQTLCRTPLYQNYETNGTRLASFDQTICDENKMRIELLVNIGYYQCNPTKIACFHCGVEADLKDDIAIIINKHYENNKCCPNLMRFYDFIETLCDLYKDWVILIS